VNTPPDFLANAERLISDAKHMHEGGRSRSAATLIVVAIEQLGAFVEALTKETYPDADVHMGIFGENANAHAKRQDALASHIMNYAFGQYVLTVMSKRFALEGGTSEEEFLSWLIRTAPHDFSDEEEQEQRECPNIAAANLLMRVVRTNQLKELREYGLYENTNKRFSEAAVKQTIELAAKVREMLAMSWVVPEALRLAGVNMPEGQVI
jgi:hypothetical protein